MFTTLNKIRACQCGCGQPAPIASRTNSSKGEVKGEQLRFLSGHNKRLDQTLDHYMRSVSKTPNGCWTWGGSINRKGYGRAQYKNRHHNAHRVIYQLSGFAIPKDMHLDHICRNKLCVNPLHMDPVTPAENNKRKSAKSTVQADLLRIVCTEIEQREAV